MFKHVSLVLMLCLSFHAEWVQLESHGPHFTNTFKEPYVLLIAYNSEPHPGIDVAIRDALTSLEDDEFVKENEIILEWADCVQNEFWNKHYDLDNKNGLRFFIKNQMTTMPDFDEKVLKMMNKEWTAEQLRESVVDLMRREIDDIVNPISTLEMLTSRAKEEGVVCVYLGEKSQNFDRYFQFARKHTDASFFYNFDLKFKQEVYMKLSGLVVPKGDVFAIVKSEDMLNDFDPYQVVSLESFDTEKEMATFFEFERYPKLRNEEHANDVVRNMFFKGQILFLYAYKGTPDPQTKLVFEESVKILPSKIIYATVDTESRGSASYLQLFMMSNQMLMPETMTMLYVTPSKKVKIEAFNGEKIINNIVDFVYDFYKSKQPLVEQMTRHLYDMPDLTPAPEEEIVTEEL